MFKKILLPLDGSEFSERAFETGMELAQQLGIPIVLTHIIDQTMFENILAPVSGGPVEMAKPVYDDIQEKAEDFLRQKEGVCKENGIKCETILKMGHPANTVLALAKEMGTDLVVVGSHGRGRIAGLALGSISYGIIHKAEGLSVLVVR